MSAIRAITSGELTNLRSEPQWGRLYLAGLEAPRVIFAAQVNQSFPAWNTWDNKARDMILEIAYDGVTQGAYTDIIPGMTLWVGTAAGKYDVGVARIRKAADATKLYIGEISDIKWDDNLYLTVIDEFGLWPKHVRISSGTVYMDGDITYTDQHSLFDPVPVLGSDLVLDISAYPYQTAAGVLDASDSWVFESSITGYAWTATEGTLTGANTAAPQLTISAYPTGGKIRLSCTVTAANGKSFSGYRYVHVYDQSHRPENQCRIASIEADYDAGGWQFDIEMVGDISYVRDRAKVILFAEDFYEGQKISIGQQKGRENIICEGWIDGETIEYNAEMSAVRFTVKGAWHWLDKMPGFPPGVETRRAGLTAAWTNIPGLDVDRALWHLLHWRSTATAVMDCRLTIDSRFASAFEVPAESLWAQMIEIAQTSILASPGVDRYGRLFVQIDPQYQPVADRDGVEIMTITKADWQDIVSLERRVVGETAMLDLSGVALESSTSAGKPIFSLAPGHIFKRYGAIETLDRLLLESQTQANELAGLVMGRRNNPLPDIEIKLAANNRMIDLYPRQYCIFSIDAADTVRGLTYSGRLIPRSITIEWDEESGALIPTITFEPESFPELAIDGDPPANNPGEPAQPPPAPPPPLPPPGGGGTTPEGPHEILMYTRTNGWVYTLNAHESEPQWFLMNGGLTQNQYAYHGAIDSPMRYCVITPHGIYALCLDTDDPAYLGQNRGATHIFRTSGLGAYWEQFLHISEIGGYDPENPDKCRIIGIGQDTAGKIFVAGGQIGDMRILIGNESGLSEVASGLDARQRIGTPIYNQAKWLLLHAEDNTFTSRAWSRLSAGGGIEINTSNDFGTLNSAADRNHFALNMGGTILYWTYGTNIVRISNNDPTSIVDADKVTGVTTEATNDTRQCAFASSPSGVFLMGGNDLVGKRSSDGGSSWGNVGGYVGATVWANAGDDMQWAMAGVGYVKVTLDWGDTWRDITGNLTTLIGGLFNPRLLYILG